MDDDPNAALNNSFDALESAFTDESRKLIRQIKFEWQKILKYKEEISIKEEELVTSKTTLMHLNEIKEENEKYIKLSENRIVDLQQSNKQLKSKLSVLRNEEERSAKKCEEYKMYMQTKINFFLDKWNERYKSHYSKYPKIKEREQALEELEQVRMKSYELDEELRKYEKKLFQAKRQINKRAMEESKFYPFSTFVVNVAKIYLKTVKENDECQKIIKERQITENISSPQKPMLNKGMKKTPQMKDYSKVSDDIAENNSITKQVGSWHMENSRTYTINQHEELNIQSENLTNWNKEDKLQTITQKIQEQCLDESKNFSRKSSLANKWLEKYKVYNPKMKVSLFDNDNRNAETGQEENKQEMCLDFQAKDKCYFQSKPFSVFDRIKNTETLKPDPKIYNPVSPFNYKTVEKKEALSKNPLQQSEFSTISATEGGKENDLSTGKNAMQFLDNSNKEAKNERNEPMELDNGKKMQILGNLDTFTNTGINLEKHQMQNQREQSKYFNACSDKHQKNIMQRVVTPFQQDQNESVNQHVSNESPHSTKSILPGHETFKLSTRCTQVATGVVPPSTKENMTEISSIIDPGQSNLAESSEAEPMEVDISSSSVNENLVEANMPKQQENKQDKSLSYLNALMSGVTVQQTSTNHPMTTESKYFKAAKNDMSSLNNLSTLQSMSDEKMPVETKGSHGDRVDKVNLNRENAYNTQMISESQKIAYVSPTLQQNQENSSPQNHAKMESNKINDEIQLEEANNVMQQQQTESVSAVKSSESTLNSNITNDTNINKEILPQGNLQRAHTEGPQDTREKEDNQEEQRVDNEILNNEGKLLSSHTPTSSDYQTPTSHFSTPKEVEKKLKTSTKKISPKSAEKAPAYFKDSPNFTPFDAESVQSPGFNYPTRLMYQPSTSKATEPPTGGQINMFELSSFLAAEKTKVSTQSKGSDDGNNDFLFSAYEKYLEDDSPPLMKDGDEKNLFAFNDNDSPDKNTGPGGFFPLFASEDGKEEKKENPFNFNFGETSSVKSPEETKGFSFLF